MIGWLLVTAGSVLALPQVVDPTPWQAGFLGGLLLAIAGGVVVVER